MTDCYCCCFDRIEEMSIQDIAFLYGCSNPTVVIIHQDAHGRHVKAHEISLRDKEFAKVSFHYPFVLHLVNIQYALFVYRCHGNKIMLKQRLLY